MFINFQNVPDKFVITGPIGKEDEIVEQAIPVVDTNKEPYDIVLGEGQSLLTISSGVS